MALSIMLRLSEGSCPRAARTLFPGRGRGNLLMGHSLTTECYEAVRPMVAGYMRVSHQKHGPILGDVALADGSREAEGLIGHKGTDLCPLTFQCFEMSPPLKPSDDCKDPGKRVNPCQGPLKVFWDFQKIPRITYRGIEHASPVL